ncbi:MAG TPA: tol-pal system protein YbgF [Candidatus Kryptonia bacterium]|nr:tol-pal system protein YbgF [Candidatus Kryptonia bacterium]
MRVLRHPALPLLVCLTACGCATRADLLKVQDDQRKVRALLADTQVAVDGLRRRVDALQSQGDAARGPHGRGSAHSTEDLERRVAELESKLQAPPLQPSAPGQVPAPTPIAPGPSGEGQIAAVPPPPPVEPPPAASPRDVALAKEEAALQGAKIDEDYADGIHLVRGNQCDQAVPKLRQFLRKNPKSDLADNAQYWIGECYYGQKDYNKAIIELNEVLLKYAKGDKVPAALLTLASAFADSGDKIDARLILQKLISDHPKTDEAERGRQKLQSLGD